MINLCTRDVGELMMMIDGGCPDSIDGKTHMIDPTIDDLIELNYLDPLYEENSKLAYGEWRKRSG